MMGTPSRLSWLTSPNNSSEAPLFESRIATSRRPTMPRSPCNESTGWRNDAGVPVDVSVAAILRASERRSDLAGDEAGLADPGDDQPARRPREEVHGRREGGAEPLGDPPDRLRFEGEDPAAALNEIVRLRARHRHAPRSTS